MLDLMRSIFIGRKRSRPKFQRPLPPFREPEIRKEPERPEKFSYASEEPPDPAPLSDENDEQCSNATTEDSVSIADNDSQISSSRECRPKRRKRVNHHMQRRYNTWLSSVRSYLEYVKSDFISKYEIGPEASSESNVGEVQPSIQSSNFTSPQTEEELNNFLRYVWKLNASKVPKEVMDLKVFYVRKLRELTRNYVERTKRATKSGNCVFDELYMTDYISVKEQMKQFERLQFELKNMVAKTIIQLMPQSLMLVPFRSIRKLSEKALKYLNKWFLFNINYPYPSPKDKEKLAERCGISIQQVSNWFCKKRQCTASSRLRKTGGLIMRRRKARQRPRPRRSKKKVRRKQKRRPRRYRY